MARDKNLCEALEEYIRPLDTGREGISRACQKLGCYVVGPVEMKEAVAFVFLLVFVWSFGTRSREEVDCWW